MKLGLWTLHLLFKYWQRAWVCVCVHVWKSEAKRGRARCVCVWIWDEARTDSGVTVCVCVWGQCVCAEVIYSALTYSFRWSAVCSKPHTPKGIDCVCQLTFRVGKTHWWKRTRLQLFAAASHRHTLTSLQFQLQCLLTKLCIFTMCVCIHYCLVKIFTMTAERLRILNAVLCLNMP